MTVKNLGKKPVKPLLPEDEIRLLIPMVEMMDGLGWQSWRNTVEGELELLGKWSWRVGAPVKMAREQVEISKLLDELGCAWPKDDAEMQALWGRFRAVVNYFRSKLETLDGCRARLAELQRSIEARRERKGGKEG